MFLPFKSDVKPFLAIEKNFDDPSVFMVGNIGGNEHKTRLKMMNAGYIGEFFIFIFCFLFIILFFSFSFYFFIISYFLIYLFSNIPFCFLLFFFFLSFLKEEKTEILPRDFWDCGGKASVVCMTSSLFI